MLYAAHSDTPNRNVANSAMLNELDSISDPTVREKIVHAIIKPIISMKQRFGLRVMPTNFRKAAFNWGRLKCLPQSSKLEIRFAFL
jgi:hypothetical protein